MAQVDETVEQLINELETLRARVVTLQKLEAQSREAEERTRAEWEAHKQAAGREKNTDRPDIKSECPERRKRWC